MEALDKKQHTSADCLAELNAVEDALYVLGGKWRVRIIIALGEGKMRFNELQRTLKGISARVLSNELKELELNGLITRTTDEAMATVAYKRTEYAVTVRSVILSLREWGIMHKRKITQH